MFKVLKIDHIGIAVKNLENAATFWEGVLGLKITEVEEVASQKVKTAFFPLGESKIHRKERRRYTTYCFPCR